MMHARELTAEEMRWLKEVDGSLLQLRLPDHIENRLAELGLVKRKLGGLARTAAGNRLVKSNRRRL
jgi:hypothetical protein